MPKMASMISQRLGWTSAIVCFVAFLLYSFDVWHWTGRLTQLSQEKNKPFEWDVLRHLGGYSPWIQKTNGVLDIEVPEGCLVDQIHMMSRHAERYPTLNAGIRMLELYQRLQYENVTFHGDLAFLNEWNFFAPYPNEQFDQLTTTGPYAGTLEAFATGVKLRTRYEKLLEQAISSRQTSFWASDCQRVIETAKIFATGFFGVDWKKTAALHVVPEDLETGGNTLTPGRACPKYGVDLNHGHNNGIQNQAVFRATYLPAISKRLQVENPDIVFNDPEIYAMQEMCGFETLSKGSSQWCRVFTRDEWQSFEYARDLLYYYRSGPGNRYGPSLGWLWLNATADLLWQGPDAGPLFFTFNHDGDIVAMLGALNLFPEQPHLPTSSLFHNRTWRMSDVTPMGGRLIFERLSCPAPVNCWDNAQYGYPNHLYCEPPRNDSYVRINVNDGIVPLPGCHYGPGGSCPLDDFVERIRKRGEEIEPFHEICELEDDKPKVITFLHQ